MLPIVAAGHVACRARGLPPATTDPTYGRDDCLIRAGYIQCYRLVIAVTFGVVNRPPVFSPKFRASGRSFWHCGAPAVLVRGGPDGAPGQVQRVGGARRLPRGPRTRNA